MTKKQNVTKEAQFSKEQILSSKKYKHRKDILQSLLADEKSYSSADVDATLEKFMKGKVN